MRLIVHPADILVKVDLKIKSNALDVSGLVLPEQPLSTTRSGR